ncbi:MAG: hypothetical protein ACKOE6_07760, partial [Flammeovirgaceae bacterium]
YNVVSFADSVMFKWAKQFLIAFLLLIAIRVLFFVLNPEWDEFGRKFWYYLSFSILFYYMSISGYANSILSATSFQDYPINYDADLKREAHGAIETESRLTSPDNESSKDYKNEVPDLDAWKEKIEKLMLADKMYENPELVISDLSGEIRHSFKKSITSYQSGV